jgi:hypothetical protein
MNSNARPRQTLAPTALRSNPCAAASPLRVLHCRGLEIILARPPFAIIAVALVPHINPDRIPSELVNPVLLRQEPPPYVYLASNAASSHERQQGKGCCTPLTSHLPTRLYSSLSGQPEAPRRLRLSKIPNFNAILQIPTQKTSTIKVLLLSSLVISIATDRCRMVAALAVRNLINDACGNNIALPNRS